MLMWCQSTQSLSLRSQTVQPRLCRWDSEFDRSMSVHTLRLCERTFCISQRCRRSKTQGLWSCEGAPLLPKRISFDRSICPKTGALIRNSWQ